MSDFFEHESSATSVSGSSVHWKIKADVYKSKEISEKKQSFILVYLNPFMTEAVII